VEPNKVSCDGATAAAKVLFGVFFAALVLFRPLFIQDYLTNSGWIYLAVLVFLISIFLSSRQIVFLPSKRVLIFFGFFMTVLVLTSATNGATFLEERWTQRYLTILLLLIGFQLFNSESSVSKLLKYPISLFILFICLESIYQYLFLCKPNDPMRPFCHASRFWNINMLSQALVLSIPFLLLIRKDVSKKFAWSLDFLAYLAAVAIFLTGCRSSLLALILFFALQAAVPFVISRGRAILILMLAIISFSALYIYKKNTLAPFGEGKQGSANYRLEVWKRTVDMSLDFPSGIGVNNFEFGFLPYKRDSKIQNVPWEVDKSPHNEFIRFLAEEGWAAFVVLLLGCIFLGFAIARKLFLGKLTFQHRLILIALPEFVFQFPTEMYFPVILFCIASAIEFSPDARSFAFKPIFKASLIGFAGFVLALFVIRNIQIVSPKYSMQFCSAFADDWKMCGDYFKYHLNRGDSASAAATIRPVIRRQPFNFIALNFDYLLGNINRNNSIICNYYSLFNGNFSIEGSDISKCNAHVEKSKLLNDFILYAKFR